MTNLEQQFDVALQQLPAELRAPVAQFWQRSQLQSLDWSGSAVKADWLASLPRVWACSEFVALSCTRDPALLRDLVQSGDLRRNYGEQDYAKRLQQQLAAITDEAALMSVLRKFRKREMVRIAWRDIAAWSDLNTVMNELSWLAEACIDTALTKLDAWLQQELGVPCNRDGETQALVVIGMGKLGAWELNFSSDVDLIFAFGEAGETRDGPRPLSNEEYFTRLGRRLIKVLDQVTEDGFVFRVDVRLRPFGDSGPMAMSFDVMEHYYQVHGREWERYALIKARVVAGDRDAGKVLLARLKPFVYRRYLDYGAFESLREMKQMIALEVQRKDLEHNIKLGAGGIREIEFIGQAFQLIRGGREPELQQRSIRKVLATLAQQNYLPDYVVRDLDAAYVFLRNTEHRLQAYADQQTHTLPQDDVARLRLAYGMGYANWQQFGSSLEQYHIQVHASFEQVFEAPQSQHEENDKLGLTGVWSASLEPAAALLVLEQAGYSPAQEAQELLQGLRNSRDYRVLSATGRKRMDKLMPLLLGAIGQGSEALVTLKRVLDLLQSFVQRTVYLALLVENPMALSQLVRLCRASPWIANFLGQHPLLLDELLDPRDLYVAQSRSELAQMLRQRLQQIDIEDLEQAMDALRHFKQASVLRVAAADISGAMPLMVVSDHLTWIAEVILEQVLDIAWRYLVLRHGRPVCTSDGQVCDTGFAVVAYGKLGGIELGYGSDLDLVFLHASENEQQETQGARPITAPVFFARLGQRMIHVLTARTPAGTLYEVDTRLRPNGASGLLVSNLQAFNAYQQRSAWTWEHQALVRARVVAGDPMIAQRFEAIRREALQSRRNTEDLRREVCSMRERMRRANSASKPGEFDLKQDAGGIADIEFMVQYGVLAWACDHPGLLTYTDNIRLLAGFAEAGLLSEQDVTILGDAYRGFRARVHRLTLQQQPAVVSEAEFAVQREAVLQLWNRLMEPGSS